VPSNVKACPWITRLISNNLASRWIRRVLRVATGLERRAIEQSSARPIWLSG